MPLHFSFSRTRKPEQSGYALFDALFGSFVLAAALAIAGYNANQGHKAADFAWYGQQALVIAEDIANRIRINANNHTSFGAAYTNSSVWQTSTSVCSDCTPQQKVRQDGFEVRQMIELALPEAGARVNQCGIQLCIFVWWLGNQPVANSCTDSCVGLTILI